MSFRNLQDCTHEAVLAGLLFSLLLKQTLNNLRSQPFHGLGSTEQTVTLLPRHWHSLVVGPL